jgi:DNA polymerase III gamma/tau subunit
MEHGIEESKAELLSHLSQGCLGWAFSAMEDNSAMERRLADIDMISSLLSVGIEKRFAFAGKMANEASRDRQSATRYIDIACSWWRDLMHIKGNCQETVVNTDYLAVLEEQAKSLSLANIKDFIINLYSTEEQISRNVNTRLAFESLMINMPKITVSTE